MKDSIQSLVRSIFAFLGVWFAFLGATIFNAIIPMEILQRFNLLKFLITDSMVEFRVQIIRSISYGGGSSITSTLWTLFSSATLSFFGYFREIFVIVTLFHFTPYLEGMEFFLILPRWLKRFCKWTGIFRRNRVHNTGQDDDDDEFEFDEPVEYASEPPELEDCSDILLQPSPHVSTQNRKQFRTKGSPPKQLQPRSGSLLFPIDTSVDGDTGLDRSMNMNRSEGSNSRTSTEYHSSKTGDSEGMIAFIPTHSVLSSTPTSTSTSATASITRTPPLSPQRGSGGRTKEWYVYDPVFGVIPRETRDLWQSQENDSAHRQQALLEAARQLHANNVDDIPPVRFSKQYQQKRNQRMNSSN